VEVAGHPQTTCGGALNVGYRIRVFRNGMHAAVWYPALNAESSFQYPNGFSTAMAKDAPVANCGRYPLVIFSHGFTGCGTQSVFFTEELARHGYIVVAPDHNDALCRVDQPRGPLHFDAETPFGNPGAWSENSYLDRKGDLEQVLLEMLTDPDFSPCIDPTRIGGAGHSLGGYSIMGLAGGWSSWRDGRLRAVLLFSPYAAPFLFRQTVGNIRIPVMYQGGTRDLGITPSLKRPGGAYDSSNSPKYFVEFNQAGHLDFSVQACREFTTVAECNQKSEKARLINSYGIAFFDRYLAQKPGSELDKKQPGVVELRSAR
jgi:predicted dienelactone hydrolase